MIKINNNNEKKIHILLGYSYFMLLKYKLRPYNIESTGSRPISAVKQYLDQSVLWWGTTWEYWLL